MAAVVSSLAEATGWPVPPTLALAARPGGAARALPPLPVGPVGPDLLGRAHEALLDPAARRAGGAHYTPSPVAAGLLRWATVGFDRRPLTVCDPAVGGGAFLLAAAELLRAAGADPGAVVRHHLWGLDVDPLAVAVTRAALAFWAWRNGADPAAEPEAHVRVADALHEGIGAWPERAGAGFDLVIGNPPFQNQLGARTARTTAASERLRDRLGVAVGGYVDTAALFLVAGRRLTRPGGRLALVLPEAVLGTRDAAGARAEALSGAALEGLWVAREPVFRAKVRVGAVVVQVEDRGPSVGRIRRAAGPEFAPLPEASAADAGPDARSWSWLLGAAYGTPTVRLAADAGRVGDRAAATAGFRDEYYGLVPFVGEAADAGGHHPRLVTSGLIDPMHCRWGDAPCRFARRRWHRPVVDVAALRRADPRLGRWVDALLVPKVLVAAQTRVVEAVVDSAGHLVPSVPVIALTAPGADLAPLAAVLHAPAVSAWALHRAGGSALASDAVKLSARQVLDIPLPTDATAWAEAAAIVASASPDLAAFAAAMNRAYGLDADHEVGRWWLARLPRAARH